MDEIIGQLAGLFLLVSALPIYMIARRKGVSTPGIIPWLRHLSISVRGSCGWDLVGSLPDKALLDRISQMEG